MFGGFSSNKLKPQLKMAVSRINIASNKKAALLKQSKREIAVMLAESPPREEKAKIRAEALIRDDYLIEAYEILQLQCELLHERIKLIEYEKNCPSDLVPVVSTLMWASHRVDIPELVQVRKQFRAKYGKKFEEVAMTNPEVLNQRVVAKLSVEPPAAFLVQTYLEKICEEFEVQWEPKVKLTAETMAEPMAPPSGYSVPVAHGTGLGSMQGSDVLTGQLNADEEINFVKQNAANGGYTSAAGMIPPPIITATPAMPSHSLSDASSLGGTASLGAHSAAAKPSSSAATTSLGPAAADDFAEPDIFVPQAPPSTNSQGNNNGNARKDNCNDNDTPSAGGGSTPTGQSYRDLAARFNALNK